MAPTGSESPVVPGAGASVAGKAPRSVEPGAAVTRCAAYAQADRDDGAVSKLLDELKRQMAPKSEPLPAEAVPTPEPVKPAPGTRIEVRQPAGAAPSLPSAVPALPSPSVAPAPLSPSAVPALPSPAATPAPTAGSTATPGASGGAAGQPSAGSEQVKMASFAFAPLSITVKVGTTVTWTNQDASPHTVTADDGSFDSGSLAQGATFSQTFTKAGTFPYHCTFHSTMHGTVTVTQ